MKNYSTVLGLFQNKLIIRGLGLRSENWFLKLKALIRKDGFDPNVVLKEAIHNVTPLIELKSKRIGGVIYRIPLVLKQYRSQSIGVQSLINGAKKRKDRIFLLRLKNEIMDSYRKRGTTYKRVLDIHKQGMANRSYIRYLI
jgi:small subunit ribosomal protein S7